MPNLKRLLGLVVVTATLLSVTAVAIVTGTVAPPAAAAVAIRRVGPGGHVLLDMTPSGRYALLQDIDSGRVVRVDTVTNKRVVVKRVGEGYWNPEYITDDGRAVVGMEASGYGVVRVDLVTGATRRVRLLRGVINSLRSIDATGRKVAIVSSRDENCCMAVFFIADTTTGRLKNISKLVSIHDGLRLAGQVQMSSDGSFAVFSLGSTAEPRQIYRYSVSTGTVTLAVRDRFGRKPAGGDSDVGDVSGSGRFVVFFSTAKDLVPGASTSAPRYYVRDLRTKTTTLLPLTPAAILGEYPRWSTTIRWALPVINHDGTRIAYVYDGKIANLPGRHPVVGRYDRTTGQITKMVGRSPSGVLTFTPFAIDASGKRVAYTWSGALDPQRPCLRTCSYLATG
jgi:hypothetical protein